MKPSERDVLTMTTGRHNLKKFLAAAIMIAFGFCCNVTYAQNEKVDSLLKSLNTAKLSAKKHETIAVSIIKQDNFNAEGIKNLELSHVGCGPLSKENTFHLTEGNALFNPKRDIIVLTNLAKIFISSGSAICVFKPEPNVLSIYNLHSGSDHKIIVEINGQSFIVATGVHITMCPEGRDFATVSEPIAYRNLQSRKLAHDIHLYSSEFSIPSAVIHINLLHNMLCSNNRDEQTLVDQLLRDFFVLNHFSKSNERYTIIKKSQPAQLSVAKSVTDKHNEHLSQASLAQ